MMDSGAHQGVLFLIGLVGSAGTAVVSDAYVVDALCAVTGGWVAMSGGQGIGKSLWKAFIGVGIGLGLAIIMRSGDFGDFLVRVTVFLGAVMSTTLVEWIRNPQKGLEAAKAFAGMAQSILGIISGKK